MRPIAAGGDAGACPWLLVDAFVGPGARGNPAAVVLLPELAPEAYLQGVAAEFAQAETAFVAPLGAGQWALRWFTPRVEAALCGHATLAAAGALAAWGLAEAEALLRFDTASGPLWAQLRPAAAWAEPWASQGLRLLGGRTPGLGGALALAPRQEAPLGSRWGVALDFPSEAPEAAACPPALAAMLGELPVLWVGRNRLAWMVAVADEAALRAWPPPFAALEAWGEELLLTAQGSGPWDVVSRYFAPACGIPEDQVTGSAHAALGPWWAQRLGRQALGCWQASERGGAVAVWPWGQGRVGLGGQARVVAQGRLLGPSAW